jgi:hydroxymethylbilane synthase
MGAGARELRVGARGSDLSLAQTGWLIDRLRAAHPGLTARIVTIETHGDKDQSSALDRLWPPGGFVREVEQALLDGRIDLAVHSLKDMPTEPVPGLIVAAVPARENPADVLLTREPVHLDRLHAGFRIGSSSPRRTHQLLRHAPRVTIEPIRGNVPTRIRKVMEGVYDGVILAAAGLSRLKIAHEHVTALPLTEFLPAPGQGALAAQTREDSPARALLAAIDDAGARACTGAERAFLRACGGGCHAALGALATVSGGVLTLRGHLFVDGARADGEERGDPADAEAIGAALARRVRPGAG